MSRIVSAVLLATCMACMATPPSAAEVTVFAAASLKEALDDQAKRFEADTGNKVVVSYAASNTLAKQIEAGAPAEPLHLRRSRLDGLSRAAMASSRRVRASNLLRNTLVLIAPAASTVSAEDRTGLRSRGSARLGASSPWPIPTAVPAGKYGKAALESLGVWAGVEKQVVRSRQCARRAGAGRARRGAVRHRLHAPTRSPRRACASSTRSPSIDASADRLSGGARRGEPSTAPPLSALLDYLALGGRARASGKATASRAF